MSRNFGAAHIFVSHIFVYFIYLCIFGTTMCVTEIKVDTRISVVRHVHARSFTKVFNMLKTKHGVFGPGPQAKVGLPDPFTNLNLS